MTTPAALSNETCAPCRGGVGKLDDAAIADLLPAVPGWTLAPASPVPTLQRRFEFRDFVTAMAFVGRMADLAEAEGHHPDFTVRYKLVDVSLSTHDVGGLSRNDFILAAKLTAAASATPTGR